MGRGGGVFGEGDGGVYVTNQLSFALQKVCRQPPLYTMYSLIPMYNVYYLLPLAILREVWLVVFLEEIK